MQQHLMSSSDDHTKVLGSTNHSSSSRAAAVVQRTSVPVHVLIRHRWASYITRSGVLGVRTRKIHVITCSFWSQQIRLIRLYRVFFKMKTRVDIRQATNFDSCYIAAASAGAAELTSRRCYLQQQIRSGISTQQYGL